MQMTDHEKAYAKRAGADGEKWIEARRESPGLTLLEFRTRTGRKGSNAVELDLPTTAPEPTPEPPKKTAKKTTAKPAAK